MTKAELLTMSSTYPDDTQVVIYDGDDSTFKLEFYGHEDGKLWLLMSFNDTVEQI